MLTLIQVRINIFYIPSRKIYYCVLLSWLNLDIGFDVCFYRWKAYKHVPENLASVGFSNLCNFAGKNNVLLSRCSIRFSMLLVKKNPVATLAMLILFSYTKLLCTVIIALSKANVQWYYTDHICKSPVWLFDPNVNYGTGKHISIPLFAAAILIIVVGVTYTFLLLSWQWLLKYIKFKKVCHYFDTYQVQASLLDWLAAIGTCCNLHCDHIIWPWRSQHKPTGNYINSECSLVPKRPRCSSPL